MRSKSKWLAFLIDHAGFFVAAVLKLRLLLPKHSFTQTVCQKLWNPILSVSVTHEQRSESVSFSECEYWQPFVSFNKCEYWQPFLSFVAKPAVTLPLSQIWQLKCRHNILQLFFPEESDQNALFKLCISRTPHSLLESVNQFSLLSYRYTAHKYFSSSWPWALICFGCEAEYISGYFPP